MHMSGLIRSHLTILLVHCNYLLVVSALAEILSVKEIPGRKLYYVHYIDCEYEPHVESTNYKHCHIVHLQHQSPRFPLLQHIIAN